MYKKSGPTDLADTVGSFCQYVKLIIDGTVHTEGSLDKTKDSTVQK